MTRPTILCAVVLAVASPSLVRAIDDPAVNDAALNDVFFVDGNSGWVVGDRGVILHTRDGGASWQLQRSGAVCSLRGVWFRDDKTGWVVGGQGLPYSAASAGLILGTLDGGETWSPLSWQQYPRLLGVQSSSAKLGWAWGESSDFFPTGLVSSEHSGRQWHPAGGSSSGGWLAGAFLSDGGGMLGGASGAGGVVIDRVVRPTNLGSFGARSVRRMRTSNDGTVWAVGDGALVLRSDTQGSSWRVTSPGMSSGQGDIFDWHGVHAMGEAVWVVGRPGSVVLHSADAGRTWQSFSTGSPVPLEAVWFHDRKRGWAVGALGTIVATTDGGRSWRAQRRGGERAALLAVHAEPQSTPLLTHVQLGHEHGYLSVDLAMVRPRRGWDEPVRIGVESRLADAVTVAGGSRAECEWRFPAHPLAMSLNHVIDEWNRQTDGRAVESLERRLVVAIRTWRPEAIVTDSPDPAEGGDPTGALVSQALERAFQSAADAKAFPELAETALLPPWPAKKLYMTTQPRGGDAVEINGETLSRTSGRPLDELAGLATSLVADSFRAAEARRHYRLVASRLATSTRDDSLMAGILLEPGGPARRQLVPPIEIDDAQRRAVETRRNLLAIIHRAEAQPIMAEQLSGQLDAWLKQLGPDQSGNILLGLARSHYRAGRWTQTRDLLEKLIADYPNHIVAVDAHRWLVQFYASSEMRHRSRLDGVAGNIIAEPVEVDGPGRAAGGIETGLAPTRRAARAVGELGSDVPWARGALDTAKRLMHASPLGWSDPRVQFPLAAAQRAIGNTKDADKFYTAFGLRGEAGPWIDAARGERWLVDRAGRPAKPVLLSYRAAAPPHLDGVLDERVWKNAAPATLVNLNSADPATWQTQVRIAHDAQFLYIGVWCYMAGGEVAAPVRPRQRDMELGGHDRVHLYLDLDRDYATYYHLAADRRGCVSDDCWGDRTWNPTWYVASQSDEHGYRIEAAVPITELTDGPPRDGTVWAFNAVRVVPGRSMLAWSRPAGAEPAPEGMGYLLFSDGPTSPPPRAAVAN